MEIKGDQIWHSPSPAELLAAAGQEITLKACVHNIRELGGIAFVVLRTGRYLIQSVYDKEVCPDNNLSQLSAGDCVRATGLLRAEPRAENGVELLLHGFTVLSRPASPLPLNLADKELKATLGTKMEYRTVALRHPRERAVFRIQQALACGFREFMLSQDPYSEDYGHRCRGRRRSVRAGLLRHARHAGAEPADVQTDLCRFFRPRV